MKNLFVLLIALSVSSWLSAQNNPITQTIRGTVFDHQSGNTLKAATIQLVNSKNNSTVSDSTGAFKLTNVPIGRQNLKHNVAKTCALRILQISSTLAYFHKPE